MKSIHTITQKPSRGRAKVNPDFVKVHYSCCPDKSRWLSWSEYLRTKPRIADGTYRCKSCAGKLRCRREHEARPEMPYKPPRGTKHIPAPPHTGTDPTGAIFYPKDLSNPPTITAHSCILYPAYGERLPEQEDPEMDTFWSRTYNSRRCDHWEICWWGALAAMRNDPACCLDIVAPTVWPGWRAELLEGAKILTISQACSWPRMDPRAWNATMEVFDDYVARSVGYFHEVIYSQTAGLGV